MMAKLGTISYHILSHTHTHTTRFLIVTTDYLVSWITGILERYLSRIKCGLTTDYMLYLRRHSICSVLNTLIHADEL